MIRFLYKRYTRKRVAEYIGWTDRQVKAYLRKKKAQKMEGYYDDAITFYITKKKKIELLKECNERDMCLSELIREKL